MPSPSKPPQGEGTAPRRWSRQHATPPLACRPCGEPCAVAVERIRPTNGLVWQPELGSSNCAELITNRKCLAQKLANAHTLKVPESPLNQRKKLCHLKKVHAARWLGRLQAQHQLTKNHTTPATSPEAHTSSCTSLKTCIHRKHPLRGLPPAAACSRASKLLNPCHQLVPRWLQHQTRPQVHPSHSPSQHAQGARQAIVGQVRGRLRHALAAVDVDRREVAHEALDGVRLNGGGA